MRIPTANLSETEWQQLRLSLVRSGKVGGSDASTLLGLNPYKSKIELFYQAIGLGPLPSKMNGIMLHGKQLESYIADCWQYWDGTEDGWVANTLSGNKIKRYRKVKAIVQNPKYPALFANIDGRINRHPDRGTEAGILEIKTISGFSADMWEGGIPPSYLIQLQHYMLVMGVKWGEIAYLKDGRQLGCITFDADKELQDRILTAANEFRDSVLKAQKEMESLVDESDMYLAAQQHEPEADSSKAYDSFISEKHKARQNENVIQADERIESVIADYTKFSAEMKSLESGKQLATNLIKQHMEKESAQVLRFNGGKISWRTKFNVSYDKVD